MRVLIVSVLLLAMAVPATAADASRAAKRNLKAKADKVNIDASDGATGVRRTPRSTPERRR